MSTEVTQQRNCTNLTCNTPASFAMNKLACRAIATCTRSLALPGSHGYALTRFVKPSYSANSAMRCLCRFMTSMGIGPAGSVDRLVLYR